MRWLQFCCRFRSVRKDTAVHQLDLIRAAAEDVASARILLNERIEALEAIMTAAQDHGIPAAQVSEAARTAQLAGSEEPQVTPRRLQVA